MGVKNKGWRKYISKEEYKARLDALTPKPSKDDNKTTRVSEKV